LALWLAASSWLLGGCGGREAIPYADERCAVHGEVRVHGQPLQAGTIYFESDGAVTGVVASGPIAEGKYHIAQSSGPRAGVNRVLIEAEGVKDVPAGDPLTVTVKLGSAEAIDFDLPSQPRSSLR
jgi:hypothetical protein